MDSNSMSLNQSDTTSEALRVHSAFNLTTFHQSYQAWDQQTICHRSKQALWRLNSVEASPRTTQEALCAHMLLAMRPLLKKDSTGHVQMMFLLDARKALGLLLGCDSVGFHCL